MDNIVLETIKQRRTTRAYMPEQIKKEELDVIIEAGLYAPSAHNQQSWHFTVIQDKQLLDRINADAKEEAKKSHLDFARNIGNNETFNIFYNAPTIVIVSGEKNNILPVVDCAAASQNMLLAAESIGIGACWNGMISMLLRSERGDEYKKILKIPETHEPYYAIVLGYKKNINVNVPARKSGTVTYF